MEELLLQGLAAFGAAVIILRMNRSIKQLCAKYMARYRVCLPQVLH